MRIFTHMHSCKYKRKGDMDFMKFNVKGMSCAAVLRKSGKGGYCRTRGYLVQRKPSYKLNGSRGHGRQKNNRKAVRDAGYRASVSGTKETDSLEDTETPKLRARLVSSVIFLIILMYFSMGHMMFWSAAAAVS